jgi:hypothetical protein
MADVVYTNTTGPLIVQIPIQTQRPKLALELLPQNRRTLRTTNVTCPMTAHENHGAVRAVGQRDVGDAGGWVWRWEGSREGRGVEGRDAGRCSVDDLGDDLGHTERVDVVEEFKGW